MSKFFLFRQAQEGVGSVRISNSGKGISSIAIPSDNLSFITSSSGSINLTFNNSNIIEQTLLIQGESIEKTNISVSCKEGEESKLIESILNLISSDSTIKVILFDAVNKISTFKEVSFEGDPVVIKVPSKPTSTATGELSSGDATQEFRTIIAGVNYGSIENLPLVDYNDTRVQTTNGSAPTADDDDGNFAWSNAGTLGSTYNIANSGSGAGAATRIDALSSTTRAASGLATISATIAFNAFLKMPAALRVKADYTIYFTIGYTETSVSTSLPARNMGFMYGSNDGDCLGIQANKGARGVSPKGKDDVLQIRHDGITGDVAEAKMSGYSFPSIDSKDSSNNQVCYVFVIRRDVNSNIFVHNHLGDIVATFKSKTGGKPTVAGRTDGDLLIETIGAADVIDSPTQTGGASVNLARFGVIGKDVGNDQAVKIAQDLFARYNPTT